MKTKDGIQRCLYSEKFQRIRVQHSVSHLNWHINPEYIKEDICRQLTQEIINSKVITVFEDKYSDQMTQVYSAEVYIAPTNKDNEYANIDGVTFKLNGIVFTNEELIEAVRNTFPERLI
jgi:hypothetical protein